MTKTITAAALACAALLASAGAALADTTYTVDKITITGNKTVSTQALLDGLSFHKGSHVTQADIVAGQEDVGKTLKAANVVGGIKTGMRQLGKSHVEVVYTIDDQGAQAPIVNHLAPVLHAQIFEGNKSVASDKLAAASGLTVGDKLTNEKIAAAEAAIGAVYKAAKLPVSANLSGTTQALPGGQVDVTWHITETKAKHKSHDVEDQREQLEQ